MDDDLLIRADRAILQARRLCERLEGMRREARALAWATRIHREEFQAFSCQAEIVATAATREAVAPSA
ncbi:hypothetical protein [Methylobacterium oryzisoli]|uniref:hypothetical protein n=1 Tax=Methylobacterium oryzisoli TaxID=3385502 RepID=UPI003891C535